MTITERPKGAFYINGEKYEGLKEAVISIDQSENKDATAVTIAKTSEITGTINIIACRASMLFRGKNTTIFEALAFYYPNKRVARLALHHRRARVRKKNMRRIMRYYQRRLTE